MWIKTIKKVVFAEKTPTGTRIPCYKKCPALGFAGPVTKYVFVMFADETIWLGFSDARTRQNNYITFLFIFSGLYICCNVTFIVSVISRETSWKKNEVNLYVCILCLTLLNTYFSCLAFLFPTLTKFTTWFRKWHNTNIYTAHMKLSVLWLSRNLYTNCRCITHVFDRVLAFMEWTGSCLQQTCKQT